jgi:biotin carboxyl carrier protein
MQDAPRACGEKSLTSNRELALVPMIYDITINGKNHRLDLSRSGSQWSCHLDGREVAIDAVMVRPDVLSLRIGSLAYEVKREVIAEELKLCVGDERFDAVVRDPRSLRGRSRAIDNDGPKKLIAPMPGKVVRILVRVGQQIDQGAGVLVVEAMKMQNEIKSPKNGTLQKLLVQEGEAVNAGDVLAIVE